MRGSLGHQCEASVGILSNKPLAKAHFKVLSMTMMVTKKTPLFHHCCICQGPGGIWSAGGGRLLRGLLWPFYLAPCREDFLHMFWLGLYISSDNIRCCWTGQVLGMLFSLFSLRMWRGYMILALPGYLTFLGERLADWVWEVVNERGYGHANLEQAVVHSLLKNPVLACWPVSNIPLLSKMIEQMVGGQLQAFFDEASVLDPF